ncbi:MAG: response regulator [Cyanobacteria bacterium P01_D01_bin.123]
MSTALVVDDTKTDRELLSGCLEAIGYTVIKAGDGDEAMNQLNDTKPDIIFLDVVLPDRSGFELCRDIKAGAETRSIPIIMCSTKDTEMDKFWGMKQGADAYLSKPVNSDELQRTLNQVLAK